MNRDLKSIFYAFVAQDIEVYTPDDTDNCLMINQLICNECGVFWHTSLLECYFCGEINYYVYACTSCGQMYSITNSSIKCDCGNSNSKLIKKCMNPDCISNNDSNIANLTLTKKGVFSLSSSFNLSLIHCINCGGLENRYLSYIIHFMNLNKEEDISNLIGKYSVKENSIIIFKKKVEDGMRYGFLIYNPHELPSLSLNHLNLGEIVEELFPIKI